MIKTTIARITTILAGLTLSSKAVLAQVNFNFNNSVPNSVKGPTTAELVTNIVNTLSFIAGVASVIAIIVGGILYITSAGDEGRVRTAKNTLLYAIVGVIIALSAFAIANFVVTQIQ